MRGGSLDDQLLLARASLLRLRRLGFAGDPWLSLRQRLSALCDAARGLVHLHVSSTLHRHVKTGNMLLDGPLQPLTTAGCTFLVYRAFLSAVGLIKVRDESARTDARTDAITSSLAFSAGFCDRLFINSKKHSEKTDAFGIGASLLMCLAGDPANVLVKKREDDGIADFV